MDFKELRVKEIDTILDKSIGIYSWYLKPKKVDDKKIIKIYEFLSNFEIRLSGKAVSNSSPKFGDTFNGHINRELENKEFSQKATNVDNDFIANFLQNNALLLYIGRSKNIKNRLNQHWDCYRMNQSLNYINLQSSDFENDSSEESGYFGERLANLNSSKWFNENELFIRYFTKEDLDYEMVKNMEFLLNRIYKPILGLI